jgi:alpha-glucan phosphorylase-like protein
MDYVRQQLAKELTIRQRNPREIVARTQAITDNALVIGFARRFATYKRAQLLFYNPDRLAKIVNNAQQPIVFVFAGKAHPADKAGQDLIQKVVEMSEKPEFLGKIIFLENYDMQLARLLVQGVDVWLNTPTRPLEASGTSGMKATLNGVLNFSVLDGWWAEGYRPDAGWALKEERTYQYQEHQNQLDSETIYGILENEMVPLFYQRNADGLPYGWVQFIKQAIAEIAPQFTTKRMIDDYRQKFYNKLYTRTQWLNENHYEQARTLTPQLGANSGGRYSTTRYQQPCT